jgi:hypothetical protein
MFLSVRFVGSSAAQQWHWRLLRSSAFPIALCERRMPLLDGKPVGKRFGMAIVAAAGYEMMKILYDRRIFPNIEGLRNVVNLLGRSNEQIRRIKVEDIIDNRVVRKLEKEGLF